MASPSPNPNTFYPIVGLQDGLDPDKDQVLRKVGIRMELDDWYKSGELVHQNQRALFFPAFKKFTEMGPEEKFSFFQIAGIHSYPIGVPWDEPDKQKTRSYCAHGKITFSTWHRAYLLLFEQVIYNLMKERAAEFPEDEQPELLEAASSWRLPYWDVALKRPDSTGTRDYNVPLAFRDKDVEIRLPVTMLLPQPGQPNFPNALYQFTMPGNIRMGDDSLGKLKIGDVQDEDDDNVTVTLPFGHCMTTSRQPTVRTFDAWAEGQQNNDGVANALRSFTWQPEDKEGGGSMTEGLREAFYKLFTIENFEDFGSARPWHPKGTPPALQRKDMPFDSAEGLHNTLHNWCGGSIARVGDDGKGVVGHMSEVPVAAFDPIFWFHHCNIDRLVAIWQILHADSWFDPRRVSPDDILPTDDLRPFHRDQAGNYWNSNLLREVTPLGYTYPWLEKWLHTRTDGTYDKEGHIKKLTEILTLTYNSPRAAAEKAELTRDPGQIEGPGLMSLPKLMQETHRDLIDLTIDDYVVNVIYEKLGLSSGQPFTIHIFIGKVPPPSLLPYNFHRDGATLVGEVYNFTARSSECESCHAQEQERVQATGRVTLTNALITRWKNQVAHEAEEGIDQGAAVLASMKPEDVVTFLKGNLHWRVTSAGALVDPEKVKGLKVSLAVGKADHFKDMTKLSRFYGYKGAFEPTEGRPGGADREDGLYPEGREYRVEVAA